MQGTLLFLASFLRNPAIVAGLPTSRTAARKIIQPITDVSIPQTIVELGPGSGPITKELLHPGVLHEKSRLIVIELQPELAAYLRRNIQDPRCTVIDGDAANLHRILRRLGILQIDALISGIPFSYLPHAVGHSITEQAAFLLKPGGKIVAYQVRPRVLGLLSKTFGAVHDKWLPWNFPPLRVFTAVKQ